MRQKSLLRSQWTYSLEFHGPMPHPTAPAPARETPESGITRFGVPNGTHVECQDGISFHKMQPFSGMLKNYNMAYTGIAFLK